MIVLEGAPHAAVGPSRQVSGLWSKAPKTRSRTRHRFLGNTASATMGSLVMPGLWPQLSRSPGCVAGTLHSAPQQLHLAAVGITPCEGGKDRVGGRPWLEGCLPRVLIPRSSERRLSCAAPLSQHGDGRGLCMYLHGVILIQLEISALEWYTCTRAHTHTWSCRCISKEES